VRKTIYAGVFIALGVLLPMVFHMAGLGGSVFLPMHLPVLLAGLALGPGAGLSVGLLTPVLSFALTGMPPLSPPILPMMVAELAAYGGVAGWLARGRKEAGATLLATLGALVAGRVVLGAVAWVAGTWFGFQASPIPYVLGSVVTGLPGIVLQVVALPVLNRLVSMGTARPSQARA
jgi:riboflavin transporter FmnP